MEECRPCPVFASVILTFALQLRKKHGKTSFRVVEEWVRVVEVWVRVVEERNGFYTFIALKGPSRDSVVILDKDNRIPSSINRQSRPFFFCGCWRVLFPEVNLPMIESDHKINLAKKLKISGNKLCRLRGGGIYCWASIFPLAFSTTRPAELALCAGRTLPSRKSLGTHFR